MHREDSGERSRKVGIVLFESSVIVKGDYFGQEYSISPSTYMNDFNMLIKNGEANAG